MWSWDQGLELKSGCWSRDLGVDLGLESGYGAGISVWSWDQGTELGSECGAGI